MYVQKLNCVYANNVTDVVESIIIKQQIYITFNKPIFFFNINGIACNRYVLNSFSTRKYNIVYVFF